MASFFIFIFGLLLIGAAIAGLLFVLRRKFYRRNTSGVEEFASFGQALKANVLEIIILSVSAIVFLYGIFVIGTIFA